ncbi:type II toxin-antitoxin system RelE/ParE family toxin [Salinimicrobium tongyeongense]|uniref:type II toxin-antitoxin system RelE/ParE family toxin n=1 Tax=Salinimicrobium tongyeongense TaxID=2809707 RepID=UPI0035316C96
MAKQIVWSPLAVQKRSEILKFWIKKNKSDTYSKKLNKLFKEASHLISKHSGIGKPTSNGNVRFKIILHYLMFYELKNNKVYILTIWDSRQDPEKFRLP